MEVTFSCPFLNLSLSLPLSLSLSLSLVKFKVNVTNTMQNLRLTIVLSKIIRTYDEDVGDVKFKGDSCDSGFTDHRLRLLNQLLGNVHH